jgi:alpha-aminoadipate carrier protein LysW
VCGGSVDVNDNVMLGELLDCDDCGSELEVRSVAPVGLQAAPMAAEDWGE